MSDNVEEGKGETKRGKKHGVTIVYFLSSSILPFSFFSICLSKKKGGRKKPKEGEGGFCARRNFHILMSLLFSQLAKCARGKKRGGKVCWKRGKRGGKGAEFSAVIPFFFFRYCARGKETLRRRGRKKKKKKKKETKLWGVSFGHFHLDLNHRGRRGGKKTGKREEGGEEIFGPRLSLLYPLPWHAPAQLRKKSGEKEKRS